MKKDSFIFDGKVYYEKFNKLQKYIKTAKRNNKLFLSIIMRTQGKRISALNEVLLCLMSQTCDNFEVILVSHNANDSNIKKVNNLIQTYPNWFNKKIRRYDIKGGNRVRPLNFGYSKAKGEYTITLDDDDIVMNTYVEDFYSTSAKNFGKILHCYALIQKWGADVTKKEKNLRSINRPNIFSKNFDMQRQLLTNSCPPMTIAFPTYIFQKLNIIFDESLNTQEDWDLINRQAAIAGVYNIPKVNAIYRDWQNEENSHTLHPEKEWVKNGNFLIKRFAKMPIIYPYETDIANAALSNATIEIFGNDNRKKIKNSFSYSYSKKTNFNYKINVLSHNKIRKIVIKFKSCNVLIKKIDASPLKGDAKKQFRYKIHYDYYKRNVTFKVKFNKPVMTKYIYINLAKNEVTTERYNKMQMFYKKIDDFKYKLFQSPFSVMLAKRIFPKNSRRGIFLRKIYNGIFFED